MLEGELRFKNAYVFNTFEAKRLISRKMNAMKNQESAGLTSVVIAPAVVTVPACTSAPIINVVGLVLLSEFRRHSLKQLGPSTITGQVLCFCMYIFIQ